MHLLDRDAKEVEFIEAALRWVSLLELGPTDDYVAAWDFLYHPPGEAMTRSLMRDCIETYGGPFDEEKPETPYLVTQIEEELPVYFYRYDEGPEIGCLDVNLPLNHEVSDLSANLVIVRVDGAAAFALYDLRVM